jgi:hypothetical protein
MLATSSRSKEKAGQDAYSGASHPPILNRKHPLIPIEAILVYVEDGEEETLRQRSDVTLEILLSHPELVKELKAAYQEEAPVV